MQQKKKEEELKIIFEGHVLYFSACDFWFDMGNLGENAKDLPRDRFIGKVLCYSGFRGLI